MVSYRLIINLYFNKWIVDDVLLFYSYDCIFCVEAHCIAINV